MKISPRMCQEEGLLSGPERSQFSSWRASEPGLPGRGTRNRVNSYFFSQQLRNSRLLGQTARLRPSLRSASVLQLCPEFPRLSHLQVSAPLSTKAQPASLSNPSYHPVQENSTHALKETLVGALNQSTTPPTSFRGPWFLNPSFTETWRALWLYGCEWKGR